MPKKILKMIWKRLVQSVITIFLVTVILFLLMQLVEGNPIVNYLGSSATEEQIAYYTHLYGYDQPVLVQYWNWVTGLFKGTMGFSISYQKEISEIIFSRLSATLNLVTLAFIVAVLFGVSFGIISALNRGKMIDTVISVIANIGISMPIFWVGIILILVFSIKLNVLPAYGFVPMSEGLLMYLGQCIEYAGTEELFRNPCHPYTKGLLAAVPVPSLTGNKLSMNVMRGELTSPIEPEPGCRFAARCPYASEKCKHRDIPLREIAPEHSVACVLFED